MEPTYVIILCRKWPMVFIVRLFPLPRRAKRERMGPRDHLEQLDLRETEESPVRKALLATRDRTVHRACQETEAIREHQEKA